MTYNPYSIAKHTLLPLVYTIRHAHSLCIIEHIQHISSGIPLPRLCSCFLPVLTEMHSNLISEIYRSSSVVNWRIILQIVLLRDKVGVFLVRSWLLLRVRDSWGRFWLDKYRCVILGLLVSDLIIIFLLLLIAHLFPLNFLFFFLEPCSLYGIFDSIQFDWPVGRG